MSTALQIVKARINDLTNRGQSYGATIEKQRYDALVQLASFDSSKDDEVYRLAG